MTPANTFPLELVLTPEGFVPELSAGASSVDSWALLAQWKKDRWAALYKVGARLDQGPSLFFTLRGIEMGRFIDVAIANRVELMLQNAARPSDRIIASGEVRELFVV